MTRFICLIQLVLFAQLNAQNLSGSKWVLSSIDDLETGISKDVGTTARASLQFDSDTAYSGKFCNAYNGRFKHNKEGGIKMGLPQHTKMLCMGLDKYEKEMFEILPLSHKYRLDNETLFIFSTSHKRLTFKKEGAIKAAR